MNPTLKICVIKGESGNGDIGYDLTISKANVDSGNSYVECVVIKIKLILFNLMSICCVTINVVQI